jgi:hypothetical protein
MQEILAKDSESEGVTWTLFGSEVRKQDRTD